MESQSGFTWLSIKAENPLCFGCGDKSFSVKTEYVLDPISTQNFQCIPNWLFLKQFL